MSFRFYSCFCLVTGVRNLMLKGKKPVNILVKLKLVGDHDWYCEGKTPEKTLDLETGSCSWDECIEL